MAVAVAPGPRPTGPATFVWNGSDYLRAGRTVPVETVRQGVEQVIAKSTERVRALSERLVAGQSTLAEWQQSFALEIKQIHVAVGVVAHGGSANMSQADYGWIGQRVRNQYEYARNMAQQIASGAQPIDGRLVARAALYSDASRQTFEEMGRRDRRIRGATEERRVRRSSEGCPGCVSQAARGWQPTGVLPALGSEACRTRCKCQWQTRTGAA